MAQYGELRSEKLWIRTAAIGTWNKRNMIRSTHHVRLWGYRHYTWGAEIPYRLRFWNVDVYICRVCRAVGSRYISHLLYENTLFICIKNVPQHTRPKLLMLVLKAVAEKLWYGKKWNNFARCNLIHLVVFDWDRPFSHLKYGFHASAIMTDEIWKSSRICSGGMASRAICHFFFGEIPSAIVTRRRINLTKPSQRGGLIEKRSKIRARENYDRSSSFFFYTKLRKNALPTIYKIH